MGDEAETDMRALMGFSSFGRPRKRVRHSQRTRGADDPPPLDPTSPSLSQTETIVHHVVPGTAVAPVVDRLPASSLRVSPHGIALLIHKDEGRAVGLSASLQMQSLGERAEEAAANAVEPWSLPSTSTELLAQLTATKASFASVDASAFALARRRANPFEALGRHRFINRSAMKMANLDFLFQWTQRADERHEPLVFADVCGGPGGFSEYLLWRRREQHRHRAPQEQGGADSSSPLAAVGFGITLQGTDSCDWKVDVADDGVVEFHICNGADGTGDLYEIENIHCFRDAVRGRYPHGVDLAVADGGFPDARDHTDQELLMTRLVVAEVLTMFAVLRVGGSFVCKTFELSSPLMLQLTWLLHQCFEEFTVVKPVTSRPASSERYVVSRRLLASAPVDGVTRELERVVRSLGSGDPRKERIRLRVNPADEWLEVMTQTSDRLAAQQINACEAVAFASRHHSKRDVAGLDGASFEASQYYRCWNL